MTAAAATRALPHLASHPLPSAPRRLPSLMVLLNPQLRITSWARPAASLPRCHDRLYCRWQTAYTLVAS